MKCNVVLTLLTQLFALGLGSEKCCKDLGCFSMDAPWSSPSRPVPPPQCQDKVPITLHLFTRKNQDSAYAVNVWPDIYLSDSNYDGSKRTVFIIHGYNTTYNKSYLFDMKDGYLQREDANVFLVDWSVSAAYSYLQAASDIRIVAAQIVRFIKWLIANKGFQATRLHIIGHSLGVEVSSYVGNGINDTWRITALDPPFPLYSGEDATVRLDKNDAQFVDVVHTRGDPNLPVGEPNPIGDVDFFFNGDYWQAECTPLTDKQRLDAIRLLYNGKYSDFQNAPYFKNLLCAHDSCIRYYNAALKNVNCTFWGVKRSTEGSSITSEEYVKAVPNCTRETCSPFGLSSVQYPARGSFDVFTLNSFPYCIDLTTNM